MNREPTDRPRPVLESLSFQGREDVKQVRPAEPGAQLVRRADLSSQVHLNELVRLAEQGARQVGLPELSARQVRLAELGARQVGPEELSGRQVRSMTLVLTTHDPASDPHQEVPQLTAP
jgi:hypothetical protein